MKKRRKNKIAKREAGIVLGMQEFIKELVDKLASLYAEVEEYHRLREHLLIVLATKKPRYTLETDDPELRFIYNELDKVMFGKKEEKDGDDGK